MAARPEVDARHPQEAGRLGDAVSTVAPEHSDLVAERVAEPEEVAREGQHADVAVEAQLFDDDRPVGELEGARRDDALAAEGHLHLAELQAEVAQGVPLERGVAQREAQVGLGVRVREGELHVIGELRSEDVAGEGEARATNHELRRLVLGDEHGRARGLLGLGGEGRPELHARGAGG